MSRVLENATNQITQKYNILTHKGIDLVKYKAQTCNIIAHSEGKVVAIEDEHNWTDKKGSSYGNYVKIKHGNGYYTLYAHLLKVNVRVGEKVKQGQVIGYMGNTGHSNGAHLHFEVRNEKDNRINPTPYIDADLPSPSTITYQVYDNKKKKFLPNVKIDTNSYAGNFGNSIGGVYIDELEYRVYDNVKKKFLPWVKGRSDYAGNLGNSIGGIQIKNATYRVHIQGEQWLGWVSKVDDTNNGYAGIKGKNIDAIQIKVD